MYKVNWPRLALVFIFAITYNEYFGNNWKPQSDAEVICDGICVLLFALSIRYEMKGQDKCPVTASQLNQ